MFFVPLTYNSFSYYYHIYFSVLVLVIFLSLLIHLLIIIIIITFRFPRHPPLLILHLRLAFLVTDPERLARNHRDFHAGVNNLPSLNAKALNDVVFQLNLHDCPSRTPSVPFPPSQSSQERTYPSPFLPCPIRSRPPSSFAISGGA